MGKRTTEGNGVLQWRRWAEEQAREALEELASSGESAAGFARRKGLSPQRIAYWRKRLGSPAKAEFVAVALPAASRASIEISAGGVVVRVREELDVDHVARLVDALARRMGGAC
jgi:transposase-like protein